MGSPQSLCVCDAHFGCISCVHFESDMIRFREGMGRVYTFAVHTLSVSVVCVLSLTLACIKRAGTKPNVVKS